MADDINLVSDMQWSPPVSVCTKQDMRRSTYWTRSLHTPVGFRLQNYNYDRAYSEYKHSLTFRVRGIRICSVGYKAI